jgi:opacity protein-like surface antigen
MFNSVRALIAGAAILPATFAAAADMKLLRPGVFDAAPPSVLEPIPEQAPPVVGGLRPFWCHLGAQAGMQHTTYDHKLIANNYFNNTFPVANDHKGRANQPLVGGFGGCNVSSGSFMMGLEVDGWLTVDGRITHTGFALDPMTDRVDLRDGFSFAGSLRAGYAFGSTILYAKAGVASLSTEINNDYLRTKAREAPTAADPWHTEVRYKSAATVRQFGLLLGVGLEHLISENWSTRVEANYIFTPGERFESTITSGRHCQEQTANVPQCGAGQWNDLAGDKNTQSIRMGRGSLKFGVSRSF